ncbi:ATP-binding protein [Geitlerinema sp. PCC 9228]|uniref:ATP-binding protein n=1 Tax=Geitlerinema sp. PCC 9228 TaxID=111611 RepID=UPI0008F98688|nr:ATP-binding protein [Geitlerinema sp. PCC 9228]
MTHPHPIDEIIKRELNPFDSIYSRNFWEEKQEDSLAVRSIHQNERKQIIRTLDTVESDRQIRTVLLLGDPGSGKTYLLGRLKKELRDRAFFAYIGPWADSDHVWRHILRYTVESLMHVPEGQEKSQLLLWLESLSAFQDESLTKKILGERSIFVRNFKATYPSGISRPNDFFKALYALTQQELFIPACDWLKGEDLDTEEQEAIGIKKPIDSETDAQNILSNFCKISQKTQPIVLCFDQLDNPDNPTIIQQLLHVNTTLHSQGLNNVLVILSLITNTWKTNNTKVVAADKDRITSTVQLKPIKFEQAEEIWEKRLASLHQQAKPKPESPIYPLSREDLEKNFPGGKLFPRAALKLGSNKIRKVKVKVGGIGDDGPGGGDVPDNPIAAFQLFWKKEFKKHEQKIDRIRKFDSKDLVKYLQEALAALQVNDIQPHLLKHEKYRSYSFSYRDANNKKIGVVWSEKPNLNSFDALMKNCEQLQKQQICDSLILIRAEKVGQPHNKGYQKFQKLFVNPKENQRIIPHLDSVCYLATYHSLVNAANARELTIGNMNPNLAKLQELVRKSEVLHRCTLLQNLGIVPEDNGGNGEDGKDEDIKNHMLNIVKTQHMLGRGSLIDQTEKAFSGFSKFYINQLLEQILQEKKVQIVDRTRDYKNQVLYLVTDR